MTVLLAILLIGSGTKAVAETDLLLDKVLLLTSLLLHPVCIITLFAQKVLATLRPVRKWYSLCKTLLLLRPALLPMLQATPSAMAMILSSLKWEVFSEALIPGTGMKVVAELAVLLHLVLQLPLLLLPQVLILITSV